MSTRKPPLLWQHCTARKWRTWKARSAMRPSARPLCVQVTDTHADLIMRCGGGEEDDVLRKAGGPDVERARACADAVASAGVACMIGFQRRFDPTFAALKARLARAKSASPRCWSSRAATRARRRSSTSSVRAASSSDMLIHDFDVFRWILDDEADDAVRDRQLPERSGDRGRRATSIRRP